MKDDEERSDGGVAYILYVHVAYLEICYLIRIGSMPQSDSVFYRIRDGS
jgi:hypothetical protein